MNENMRGMESRQLRNLMECMALSARASQHRAWAGIYSVLATGALLPAAVGLIDGVNSSEVSLAQSFTTLVATLGCLTLSAVSGYNYARARDISSQEARLAEESVKAMDEALGLTPVADESVEMPRRQGPQSNLRAPELGDPFGLHESSQGREY